MTGPELLDELVAAGLPEDLAARATASSWSNGPGDRYGGHVHDYDKVLVATAGSITFDLPESGRAEVLRAGGRLGLPAGTRHGALVGENGVTCLELHLPAGALGRLDDHRTGPALEPEGTGPGRASDGAPSGRETDRTGRAYR